MFSTILTLCINAPSLLHQAATTFVIVSFINFLRFHLYQQQLFPFLSPIKFYILYITNLKTVQKEQWSQRGSQNTSWNKQQLMITMMTLIENQTVMHMMKKRNRV